MAREFADVARLNSAGHGYDSPVLRKPSAYPWQDRPATGLHKPGGGERTLSTLKGLQDPASVMPRIVQAEYGRGLQLAHPAPRNRTSAIAPAALTWG